MKQFIVLFALVAGATCGFGPLGGLLPFGGLGRGWEGGLRAKFDFGVIMGRNNFFDIPRTVEDAEAEGWIQQERPADQPLESLVLYCPNPPYLCALYDDTKYAAGLQVGLPKENLTKTVYDMTANGFSSWTPSINGKEYWTIQEYFVNEDFLAIDAETRIANRNSHKLLQADHIWVTGVNKERVAVPVKQDDITSTEFKKQACIPWMGLHYFYNMTKETNCDDVAFPWFVLYDSKELVGAGFTMFATMPIVDGERDWFERPGKREAKMIISNGADCVHDMTGTQGGLTMHTYFIDKPWLITCVKEIIG